MHHHSEAQLALLLGGGGKILFYNGLRWALRGTPCRKNFLNKSAFLRVSCRKKGNFQLLHADLPVFNSNRVFKKFILSTTVKLMI